jgi:hypothetical protein
MARMSGVFSWETPFSFLDHLLIIPSSSSDHRTLQTIHQRSNLVDAGVVLLPVAVDVFVVCCFRAVRPGMSCARVI